MIDLETLMLPASTDPKVFRRVNALVRRVNRDLAELQSFGVALGRPAAPVTIEPQRRPGANPPCHCGDPGEVNVDGAWYCVEHDPLKD